MDKENYQLLSNLPTENEKGKRLQRTFSESQIDSDPVHNPPLASLVTSFKRQRLSEPSPHQYQEVIAPDSNRRKSSSDSPQVHSVTFTVLGKQMKSTRHEGLPYCEFLLLRKTQGRNELFEAKSYGGYAVSNFEQLEEGCEYVFKPGSVQERNNDPKYERQNRSEFSFHFVLCDVSALFISRPMREVRHCEEFYESEATTTIPELLHLIPTSGSRKPFKYRLVKNVTLVAGYIYRYMGCKKCKKSNPELIDEEFGNYRCSRKSCEEINSPENLLRPYMIVNGMTIQDSDGNKFHHIVCYNDVLENLFKKKSDEFGFDDEVETKFKDLIGSEINLRVSLERINSQYVPSGFQIVANLISKNTRAKQSLREISPDSGLGFEHDSVPFPPPGIQIEGLEEFEISDDVECKIVPKGDVELNLVSQEIYSLTSNPSGYALIINIFKYHGENRIGSLDDVRKLKNVYKNLNFQVFGNRPDETFSLVDLRKKIAHFKANLIKWKISSCAIIVMGHGRNEQLVLSDDSTVDIYREIIEPFSTHSFPGYALQPKMFIFNMCRVFRDDDVGAMEGCKKTNWKKHPMPNITNAYFCFSTLAGYYSIRTRRSGSFFIDRFVQCLKQLAAGEQYKVLLEEVEHKMDTEKQFFDVVHPDGRREKTIMMQCDHFARVFKKFFFRVAEGNYIVSELDDI